MVFFYFARDQPFGEPSEIIQKNEWRKVMKNKKNLFKKITAALLAICMMAGIAGCGNSDENSTEPDGTEATVPVDVTVVSTTEPVDSGEEVVEPAATSGSTEESTVPVVEESIPAASENDVSKETEQPTETPEIIFEDTDQTVYAVTTVFVRTGPGSNYKELGVMTRGQTIVRIGIGDNGWSKVIFDGEVAYMYSDYLSTEEPVDEI